VTVPERHPGDDGAEATGSGITAGGSVEQHAGRDAVGRDKIVHTDVVMSVFGWSRFDSQRRRVRAALSTEHLERFKHRLRADYAERLDYALGADPGQIALTFDNSPAAMWNRLDEYLPQSSRPLPAGSTLASIFRETCRVKGDRLLLLGQPGSGKTTSLLDLAVKIFDDPDAPVPTYLPLASWHPPKRWTGFSLLTGKGGDLARHPVARWLATQVQNLYRVDLYMALDWLVSGRIQLLLDGLDEIAGPDDRNACVQALNDFFGVYPFPVVLSCRREEYEHLQHRVTVGKAVVIRPLEPQKVLEILRDSGHAMAGVVAVLDQDPVLLELCRSPLLFRMVTTAYRDLPRAEVEAGGDAAARRARVVGDYVDRQVRAITAGPGAGSEQPGRVKHRLAVLARNMAHDSTSVLLLENVRSGWLTPAPLRIFSTALPYVVVALLLCALIPPISAFGVALIAFFLVQTSEAEHARTWRLRSMIHGWREPTLVFAVGGLLLGLLVAFFIAQSIDRVGLRPFSVTVPTPVGCAVIGLVFGAALGALSAGLEPYLPPTRHSPYEGIRRAVRSAIGAGIFGGIASAAVVLLILKVAGTESYLIYKGTKLLPHESDLSNAAVAWAVQGGLVLSLFVGLSSVVDHYVTRAILRLQGVAPWRLVDWLEDMVKIRLLYRSSGGYVFIHRLVAEDLEAQAPASGPAH